MRKLLLNLSLAAAVLSTAFTASAAVEQTDYTENFETVTGFEAYDWAPQYWSHLETGSTYSRSSNNYRHEATGGVDNSAYVWMTAQYSSYLKDDYLVTPLVKGKVSFYVKKVDADASKTDFAIKAVKRDGIKLSTMTNAEVAMPTDFAVTDEWQKVELELTDWAMIGFSLYNTGLDAFAADEMKTVDFAALGISDVVWPEGKKVIADATGKAHIEISFTVTNKGTVPLAEGDEGYSFIVGSFNYLGIVTTSYYTLDGTVALEPGQSTVYKVEFDHTLKDPEKYESLSLRIQEQINKTLDDVSYTTVKVMAPVAVLEMKKGSTKLSATSLIDYGVYNGTSAIAYTLGNTGEVAMTVTAVEFAAALDGTTASAELPLTVEPGTTADLNIAMAGAQTGKRGTVTVKYNNGLSDKEFTFQIKGANKAEETWVEGFDNGIPAGWLNQGNPAWGTRTASGNTFVTQGNAKGSRLISPLVTVDPAQPIVFQASHGTATAADNSTFTVLYSTDRENWTELGKVVKSAGTRPPFNTLEWITEKENQFEWYNLATSRVPAGNYYLAFDGVLCYIDYIYGIVPAEIDHDMILDGIEMPSKAMVNYPFTINVTVRNMIAKAEAAEAYSVSVFDAENALVGEAQSAEIDSYGTVTLPFAYTAHADGEAAFKVVLAIGEKEYTATAKVDVEGEPSDAPAAVGTVENYKYSAPFCLDDYACSLQAIYTADELGLQAGDKISAIAFPGYFTGTSGNTKAFSIGLGNTEKAAFEEGDVYTAPEKYNFDGDYTFAQASASSPTEYVFTFDEPVVYTGGNLMVSMVKPAGTYIFNLCFGLYTSEENTVLSAVKAFASSDEKTNLGNLKPAVVLQVKQEPLNVTGTVKKDGAAAEGATVTLTSDHVQYSGTTAADGTFEIPVIQTARTYTLTVAHGETELEHANPVSFADGGHQDVGTISLSSTGLGEIAAAAAVKVEGNTICITATGARYCIYAADGRAVAYGYCADTVNIGFQPGVYIVELSANGTRTTAKAVLR